MTNPDEQMRASKSPDSSNDESPGVPGFRTWRGVYIFIFAAFVLIVVSLAIFSRVYA